MMHALHALVLSRKVMYLVRLFSFSKMQRRHSG
jgi:hypothetical protein